MCYISLKPFSKKERKRQKLAAAAESAAATAAANAEQDDEDLEDEEDFVPRSPVPLPDPGPSILVQLGFSLSAKPKKGERVCSRLGDLYSCSSCHIAEESVL